MHPNEAEEYKEDSMSHPIDKKAVYMARYPKGLVLELTAPIDDPFSPKPVGSRMRVEYIDDALQIHGVWLAPASGSIAIIIEQDSFRIVT